MGVEFAGIPTTLSLRSTRRDEFPCRNGLCLFGALIRLPPAWTTSSNISRTTSETWSTYVNEQLPSGSRRRKKTKWNLKRRSCRETDSLWDPFLLPWHTSICGRLLHE